MPLPEITFKPKYNGSMRFAFYLWPVWTALFLFFVYRAVATRNWNPDGILLFVFGIMALTMPFRVFREMRFENHQLIVKRYVIPDLVIPYEGIVRFDNMSLRADNASVSLFMMDHSSFEELEQIIHRLMSARKVRLRKK